MKCPLCGKEFEAATAAAKCPGCPMDKKCRMLCCPNCGYSIPRPKVKPPVKKSPSDGSV
jgi:hypothetical protein